MHVIKNRSVKVYDSSMCVVFMISYLYVIDGTKQLDGGTPNISMNVLLPIH